MDKNAQREETSIVPQEEGFIGIPMMPIEELKKLTAYVAQVKKALMVEGKDYVIDYDGRQYTARSGFAKLAQGFTLSDDPPEITKLFYDKPTEFKFTHYIKKKPIERTIQTKVYGFEAKVKVLNLESGRYVHGEGACTVEELHQTNNMDPKWYHRCLGTAKTRAWNRAVSNYVGSADVSAEEMGLIYEGEANERKEVESRQSYPLPDGFTTPTWIFIDALKADGWTVVEEATKSWLLDAGLDLEDWEIVVEENRVLLRMKVFLGDSFGAVASMLGKAGFNWRRDDKAFGLMRPGGVE